MIVEHVKSVVEAVEPSTDRGTLRTSMRKFTSRQSQGMNLSQIILVCGLLLAVPCRAAELNPRLAFDFGFAGSVAAGFVRVSDTNVYSQEIGYGFEPEALDLTAEGGGPDSLRSDFVSSKSPFYFSARVPEGNYRVTVHFAGGARGSTNSVKGELRRLLLEQIAVAPGQTERRTFVVNVRTPRLVNGGEVRLKDRERSMEWRAWDDKLTLEFNGFSPAVAALEIVPVDDVPTVYLLGDSTVCDQPREPWNSWGQMLPRFFKPTVSIANHAQSGESWRSSISAGRVEKVYGLLRRGDYVLAQFGHNDMKSRDPNALTIYASDLVRFVKQVRERGATPVLVTSMERKNGIERNTLGEYPETVRRVAREQNVTLIDLHGMSKVLYRALGADLDKAFQDGTHHNNYGSYQLAKCVIQGLRQTGLDLKSHVVDDFSGFDPADPDPVDRFEVPPSPVETSDRPLGD